MWNCVSLYSVVIRKGCRLAAATWSRIHLFTFVQTSVEMFLLSRVPTLIAELSYVFRPQPPVRLTPAHDHDYILRPDI